MEFSSRLRPSDNVLMRELEGESVLLNLLTEQYFGLDDVGTRMWVVLTTSDSILASYRQLEEEYDVPGEQLRGDLGALIEELIAHGLVEVEEG